MPPEPIAIDRHDDGVTAWELARRSPPPALAGDVRGYCGYEERSATPVRRREVPHGAVVLILSFGDPIDVTTERGPSPRSQRLHSFVAGLHDAPVVTQYQGPQRGLQIDLTPLGAYRLFGVPMSELTNQAVTLDDVRGPEVERVVDRLAAASSWGARFEIADRALEGWLADGPAPDRSVAWAWHQLDRSHGGVAVADLAAEIGWSRRHLTSRFREQIGLAPKPTGRVLRFRHAVDLLLANARGRRIADVAAIAGYADHSHFVREFQGLAGCTPSAFAAARIPDTGGVVA